MRHLAAPDRVLLAVLVPAWLVVSALHVYQVVNTGLAEPAFFVVRSSDDDRYPGVFGFRLEQTGGTGDLRIGDRVLAVGQTGTRDYGTIGMDALLIAGASETGHVEVVYEREGQRRSTTVQLATRPVPWSRIPIVLCFGSVAVLVLLRAPRSAHPRLFFVAILLASIGQAPFHGPSIPLTYASKLIFYGIGFVGPCLILRWMTRFPAEAPAPGRLVLGIPWFFAAGYAALRVNYFLGFIPGSITPVAVTALDGLLVASLIGVITRNYVRSDPLGRRRLKWLLYGTNVGFGPLLLAIAFAPVLRAGAVYSQAFALTAVLTIITPIGILIGIIWYRLFDIDHVISATASYGSLGVLLFVCSLTVLPEVANAASSAIGFDLWIGHILLIGAMTAGLVPLQRPLRRQLDRALFPERRSFELGMRDLIGELSTCWDARDLAQRVGEQLSQCLDPLSCAIYSRSEISFVPVFICGRTAASELDAQGSLVAVMARCKEPIIDRLAGSSRGVRETGPIERAILEELGVSVVVPVHARGELTTLICLGPKTSGDVYNASEAAWLSTLSGAMAMQLQHLDDTQLIQRGRELQDLYRSYVPGAVADQLASGQSMDARESEVTVLFVDIRGFSTYAERRKVSEIFSTVNRYTTLVSRIVGDNAGTVVEFNGDGMMAVFGAPEPTPSKERAAVVAAEEVIAAIAAHPIEGTQDTRAPLQVGIGIATGMALVGSIQAADRRIWSALGSTTNLASRLQSLSRELGAAIVIDQATHQNAGPFGARFACHPQRRIRGLARPQDVFAQPLEIWA